MTTALITHPDCLKHELPPGHPERPARLEYILKILDAPEFAGLVRKEAPRASTESLTRVHTEDHVRDTLAAIPKSGLPTYSSLPNQPSAVCC